MHETIQNRQLTYRGGVYDDIGNPAAVPTIGYAPKN